MNLIKCNHERMNQSPVMSDWMNGFFNSLRTIPESGSDRAVWSPQTDLLEDDAGYLLQIDLPGIDKEKIEIVVTDGLMEVTGERMRSEVKEGTGYRRIERRVGTFHRSFRLPKGIDSTEIESSYENGVLNIRVPRSPESLPKKIEVKVK